MASTESQANGPRSSSADQLTEIFGKMQPFIESLVDFYAAAHPYGVKAFAALNKGYQAAKPFVDRYWKNEYFQLVFGAVLLFFGGTFAMSIACYMAIRLSGWDTIKSSWNTLKRNYREGTEAFHNDPAAQKFFDADGDGKVSAEEVAKVGKKFFAGTAEEKKMVLMNLRCVFVAIDPNEVMIGVGGLWQTAIAVLATLRSQFAADVALGVSIGEMMSNQVGKYLKPMVRKWFAEDLKQWGDFLIDGGCRFIGISVALLLVRVVSALHSAVLGGQMIAKYVLKFLSNTQNIPHTSGDGLKSVDVESTTLFMAIQYGLAGIGFYWQISQGFGLNSVWLRMLLLPFSMCEMVLTFLAAY